jgi:hypothetical protein
VVDLVYVQLPSGAPFEVMGDEEADHIDHLSKQYTKAFEFSNISDIQELDRVVAMEVQTYRWNRFISRGMDYNNKPVDGVDLQKRIKEYSGEIRQTKKGLGIDAVTREKTRGEGSVPSYIALLREKARLFGIHREHQLDRALELWNQLMSIAAVYANAVDEDERRLIHHTAEDIITWILEVASPEYKEIDAYFRTHSQQYWVQDL